MSGIGDVIDQGGDFLSQSMYDLTGEGASFKKGDNESPNQRKKRRAEEKAARDKQSARERIKPIPDTQTQRTEQRKSSSRRKAQRGGRVSTLLSSRETLG